MDTENIDIYHNYKSQRWLVVHADGTLLLRTDAEAFSIVKDGYRQVTDEPITLAGVRRCAPCVAAEVTAALERLRARAADGNAG